MNFSRQKAKNGKHVIFQTKDFPKTLFSWPLKAQNLAGHMSMPMEPCNCRNSGHYKSHPTHQGQYC